METKKNSLASMVEKLDGQILTDKEAAAVLGGLSSHNAQEDDINFGCTLPVNKCNEGCTKQ